MNFFRYVKDELNICLNRQQEDAVKACDTRILLEACPGSGKTTTLVVRIAYLLLCRKASPPEILTLTFSRASARDMERRFQNLFGSLVIEPIHFSTIHSYCYRFLLYCQKKGILIVPDLIEKQTDGGKYKILKNIYYDINGEYPDEDEVEALSNEIGFVRNKMIDPEKYKSSFREFAIICQQYALYKKEKNLIDFDDMLSMTYAVLRKNRIIYSEYEKFSFVHIDEIQDTSLIQHKIIEILSQYGSLFMVGDTDQSIYGFRGAEPEYIVNIKEQFPDTKIMRLETNYRSTGCIVTLADQFIRQNLYRHPKEMDTENEEGILPRILYAKNVKEQQRHVLQLTSCESAGRLTGVLFRNNLSGLPLAYELVKKDIPFYIRENYSHFFKSFILSDVFSIFCFSVDYHDLLHFAKIYYKLGVPLPRRDILYLEKFNKEGTDIFSALLRLYWQKKYMREHLYRIRKAFTKIKSVNPYKGLCIMENELGYGEYLKRNTGGMNVFSTLKYLAEGTKTLDEFKMRLRKLKNGIDQCYRKTDTARIHLLTIHGSKGLEFDRVILIDLIEEQFPTRKSLENLITGDRKAYEEEVRLFYVGITRARKEVYLITPQYAEGKAVKPSRFINQFLNNSRNMKLMEGQVVCHQRFGKGIIEYCKDDTVKIRFELYGSRKLSIKACMESGYLSVECTH